MSNSSLTGTTKTFQVRKEAHKVVKIESAAHDLPIQRIVEFKIQKKLTSKDVEDLKKILTNERKK